MPVNIAAVLTELSSTRQIDEKRIEEEIKTSLYAVISKRLTSENELEVIANFDEGVICAKIKKLVVQQDFTLGEISLREAQLMDSKLEIGDKVLVEVPIGDFEPKIINSARKIILEKIKKIEEERIMFDYEKQKGQIVSGKIRSIDFNGYKVEIGHSEALLPPEEQVDNEYYKVGYLIKAYVVNIRKKGNQVSVILSRNRPDFVQKLFELEVPEIRNGVVVINKIVREPGIRTKVAVVTSKENIDPVGACYGPKGIRIDSIKKELNDELIDVIKWDDAPEQLIANAVGVELVEKVYLADRGKFARIVVSDKNKVLAIGKLGKNIRLAAKLTGYHLDVYTEEEFEEKIAEERRVTSHVSELDGVTPKIAETLKSHGYTSVQDIFKASVEELQQLENIGEKTAHKLKESSQHF